MRRAQWPGARTLRAPGTTVDGERHVAERVAVDVEGEQLPSGGRSLKRRELERAAAEVTDAGLAQVGPLVHGAELGDQAQSRACLEDDHLQQPVVRTRHRRDVHPSAEGPPVADDDGVRVDDALDGLPAGQDGAAAQAHAPAHDDAAQRCLGVGEASAEECRRRRGIAIDEAPDAGREHVDPPALARLAVAAGEAGACDVDGALGAGGQHCDVVGGSSGDAERAPEVATGAGGDEADAGRRRGSGVPGTGARRVAATSCAAVCAAAFTRCPHDAVDDLAERAVAADADHERPPVTGGAGGELRRVAGGASLDDVQRTHRLAYGRGQVAQIAAGASAAGGRVGDQEGSRRSVSGHGRHDEEEPRPAWPAGAQPPLRLSHCSLSMAM